MSNNIIITASLKKYIEKYNDLKIQASVITKQKDAVKDKIIGEYIEDFCTIEDRKGILIASYTLVPRTDLDRIKLSEQYPDIYKECLIVKRHATFKTFI